MIKLNNNPFENSSVKVTLSFKDSLGKYYTPLTLTYTLLALNNDKESWSIVDNIYKTEISPSSQVPLTINKLSKVEGTTLERKIIIEWKAFVDGQITDFVDEVQFCIQPMPYISNKPVDPEPAVIYVEIRDTILQSGVASSAPVNPVFISYTNLPVIIDEAQVNFTCTTTDDAVEGTITIDSTNSILTLNPNTSLDNAKSYKMTVKGLKSTLGLVMEKDYEFPFTTMQAGEITLQTLQDDLDALELRVKALEEKE